MRQITWLESRVSVRTQVYSASDKQRCVGRPSPVTHSRRNVNQNHFLISVLNLTIVKPFDFPPSTSSDVPPHSLPYSVRSSDTSPQLHNARTLKVRTPQYRDRAAFSRHAIAYRALR
ncbi:hypothetical protein J6590_060515 [Homalodisca vitripennis]|nr:hypothetical protein J6590_060515 [Homalodisca vitripennis]